jgi:hypothetical protein
VLDKARDELLAEGSCCSCDEDPHGCLLWSFHLWRRDSR